MALDRRCLLEFTVEAEPARPLQAVTCEVLVQPTSEAGLPDGQPVLLWRDAVPVRPLPGGNEYTGHVVLPREVLPELARTCYLRLLASGILGGGSGS